MNALLITLFAYAIPAIFTGLAWYAQACVTSFLYIIFIHRYSKFRERLPLMIVEFISLACISFSFASKYVFQWENVVRANITDIMTAVFLIEVFISVGGIALGVSRRNTVLRNSSDSGHQHSRIRLLLSEGNI